MQNFYPKGALKGSEKFAALLRQRHKKPTVAYLISVGFKKPNQANVYRLPICGRTQVTNYPSGCEWHVINPERVGCTLSLIENPKTGYIESTFTEGYIFDNLWHAYAYLLHLKQSNLRIDGEFPIAVN